MRKHVYRKWSYVLLCWLLFMHCSAQENRQTVDSLSETFESGPVPDQEDTQLIEQEISMSRHNALTRAIADVSSAVVGINVVQVQTRVYRSPFSDDPFFQQFFRPYTEQIPVKGLGSGFLISSDGFILTNEHVVHEASEIVVTTTDGKQYTATVTGSDQKYDVALLKITGENFPFIPFGDSDDLIIGEWAIALGNPFGLFDVSSKPTVTVGVISANGMNFSEVAGRTYDDMIQTDASINGGNSGGPLVNSQGECIGINAFIISGSENSRGSVGIGFAIPINRVKELLPDLKTIKEQEQAVEIGLEVDDINRLVARMLNIAERSGVIITKIHPGGEAERAGLVVGDVIVTMGGYRIRSTADVRRFNRIIARENLSEIDLRIYREESLIDAKLKLKVSKN